MNYFNFYLNIIFIILLLYILLNSYYKYYCTEGWGKIGRAVRRVVKKVDPLAPFRGPYNTLKRGMGVMRRLNRAPREINRLVRDVGRRARDLSRSSSRMAREARSLPGKINNILRQIQQFAKSQALALQNSTLGIFSQIENGITGTFTPIIGQITDSMSELGNIISNFFTMIFNVLKDTFSGLFRNLEGFFGTFIIGITKFFANIGQIFASVSGVFIEIFDTFISLPFCIPYYMYDMTMLFLNSLLPDWLKDVLKFLNKWIVTPILIVINFMLQVLGFRFRFTDKNKKKCYPSFLGTIERIISTILGFFISLVQQIINII